MTKSQIINFLLEKPGYLKEGKNRLALLLEDRGEEVTVEECEAALKEAKKIKEVSPGLTLKSTWVSPDGNMGFSYKVDPDGDLSEIREEVKTKISTEKFDIPTKELGGNEITVSIADLHIGAFVHGLRTTHDFDVDIARKALHSVAANINALNAKKVNMIILGDIIESFTGMNHPNSWQGIQFYGADLVTISYEILGEFFSQIVNLSSIVIIGGNHDRYTSSNKEDVQGGISKILTYFLQKAMPNMPITWDRMIVSKEYDGIVYNAAHGDLGFSRNPASDIILRYSTNKDAFNLLLEGHWHSRRKKQPVNTKAVSWDTNNYRCYTVPSIFSGNFYSESMGYSSTPGFMIFWNNGEGLPITLDIPFKY